MYKQSEISYPSPDIDSDPEVLVKVENVGKIFCRDLKKSLLYGLKDSARDLIGSSKSNSAATAERPLRKGEFWANKDISFELRRGECIGLIGHNGAGKTTLLKLLNGLIKPDSGRIEMHGKVGALIALGAGFNPILTGRENIYINGSVLGLSREEIDGKIDDIIEFSEIRDFIDSPVQTYSSGMQVRLGFAVASSLKPDILILDEVLAVGDVGFVIKCLNRIREIAKDCAVIFVSHSMQFVSSFCTRVIVMDRGMPIMDAAKPADGIDCYFGQMKLKGNESGMGGAKLESLEIIINGVKCSQDTVIEQGDEVEIDLSFSVSSGLNPVFVMVSIDDQSESQVIAYPLMCDAKQRALYSPGSHQVTVPLGAINLNSGSYSFMVMIKDLETKTNLLRKSGVAPFRVKADIMTWAKMTKPIVVDT